MDIFIDNLFPLLIVGVSHLHIFLFVSQSAEMPELHSAVCSFGLCAWSSEVRETFPFYRSINIDASFWRCFVFFCLFFFFFKGNWNFTLSHLPLCRWRLWWIFLIRITFLEFHWGKEFNPVSMPWKPVVDMCSNVKKKQQKKDITCLHTVHVVPRVPNFSFFFFFELVLSGNYGKHFS